MQCPKCSAENQASRKFCRECGEKLQLICPNCKAENIPGDKFCGECGYKFVISDGSPSVDYTKPNSYTPKHLADKILNNRSAIEGERKLVTVLFADVANYTAMAERLDPEIVHQIMDGAFKIIMEEIHGLGGTINQFTGDGVMALFGAPAALEDHAQRACKAALAIQSNIVGYSEAIDRQFQMRIGLNSGYVVVGSIGDDLRMDYTAVGDTTNLAARIQQAANAGEVWISEDSHYIVQGYFDEDSLGEIILKGKSEPQAVYRVTSEQADIRTRFEAGLQRGITELVGRKSEMAALGGAFEKAAKDEAQLVDISGEAGVGKSRLVHEFSQILDENVLFLTGTCVDYGYSINFLPLIDIVRTAFKISRDTSEAEAKQKISSVAKNDLASMVPFYQNLLSLQIDDPNFAMILPEGKKFGTFEAVKKLLFFSSANTPLVIFIEDVHWIDELSQEFFTYFTRHFHGHPILVVANYRPEFMSTWTGVKNYQKIILETLSSGSSAKIVRNMLGGAHLDPALEEKIIAKTGGNPFFVEEMIRELQDRGDIFKEGDQYRASGSIDELAIPSTVQGVLAARMDRLTEGLKETMQVASVIGRDFAFRILNNIMTLEKELREHLEKLVGFEILFEKALYPELEYIFTHALTQEVAYESLLVQRRKVIHERIAITLERMYAGKLEEYYELLAHHYDRSGNIGKTIIYLALAGEKSNSINAVQIAYEFFDKAINKIEYLNEQVDELTLTKIHQGMGEACYQIGDFGRSVDEFQKALRYATEKQFIEIEEKIIFDLAFIMHMYVDKIEANKILTDCLARSQKLGNKGLEAWVHAMSGLRDATTGNPGKGYQIITKAHNLAVQSDNLTYQIMIQLPLSAIERWIGNPKIVIETTEGMFDLLSQGFNLTYLTYLISWRGISLAEVGRIEESINLLKKGIDTCEQFEVFMRLGILYNSLGYCYSEICLPELSIKYNQKAAKIAKSLMVNFPMGIHQFAEIYAQSKINIIENLYDVKKIGEALNLLEKLKEEASSQDFDYVRYQWETRMDYIGCKIYLKNRNYDKAELIVHKNIKRTNENQLNKREGSFLQLLGKIHLHAGEYDIAIAHLKSAIEILENVGNPRLLWETYSTLAIAYNKLGQSNESAEAWGYAMKWVNIVADSLSDLDLKKGFLDSRQVKTILSETAL